ncbi:MAG: DUF3291 domain-containing protein [Rhizobiaceae bacterium]
MHLAELNISKWKVDPMSEAARGFTDNVARVNSLAERSPGFVWRKVDEERDEQGRNAVCDAPEILMTLSVWETPQDLEKFVWNTVHKKIYNGKGQWFHEMESHTMVMWWVEEGTVPTLEEARQRLDHLDANGDSDTAFGWSHLPHVKLWQEQRCG